MMQQTATALTPDASLRQSVERQRPDISVILPVYNEVENLRPLLDELTGVLDALGRSYEIIAVDDGSTDGSRKLLRELADECGPLRVILFRRNSGQTAAFDSGFRHGRGRIVVTMDADMQNDPADIPPMIAKLEEGYDFVSGWRRKRRDGFFLRRLPSRIANYIIRKVTRAPVHDLGCSLKVYKKEIADELRLYGEMHRFIAPLANNMGASIAEMEVHHRPRLRGVSKYGLSRTVKVVLDLLTIWFMRGYQTKPIYVFGGVGVAMLTAGFGTAAFVLYEKLALDIWVHKNPLFLVAILLSVVGVQFIGIGLIAEIIVRTYFESTDKTAYSVVERFGFDVPEPPQD